MSKENSKAKTFFKNSIYVFFGLFVFAMVSIAYYISYAMLQAETPKPPKTATPKEIVEVVLKTSPYCRDELRVLLQHHILNRGLINDKDLLESQKAACGEIGEQIKATRA